jgi:hypothetical protein
MLGTLAVVTMVTKVEEGQDCGNGPTSFFGLVRFRVRSGYGTGPPNNVLWRAGGHMTARLRKAGRKDPLYVERAVSELRRRTAFGESLWLRRH